jgi:predicted transcriptional regulator
MTKTFVNNPRHGRQAYPSDETRIGNPPRPLGKGTGSVREIQARLSETKETGYTTALKMLQIMTVKGLVERDETVRPQIYRARFSQQKTQKQLNQDLLHRAFGGSVKALVMQAVSTRKSSPEDLEAIEKLLDRFEGGSK